MKEQLTKEVLQKLIKEELQKLNEKKEGLKHIKTMMSTSITGDIGVGIKINTDEEIVLTKKEALTLIKNINNIIKKI